MRVSGDYARIPMFPLFLVLLEANPLQLTSATQSFRAFFDIIIGVECCCVQ